MNGLFVVRWNIKGDENLYTKDYEDYKDAKKALNWLVDQGAENVDLAMIKVVREQEEPSIDETESD